MNILVIGEEGEDQFYRGSVTRLCPEAPVPVINPKTFTTNRGMAGNVVENICSLEPTAKVRIISCRPIIKTRYVDEASGYILLRVDSYDKANQPCCLPQVIQFLNYHETNYFDAFVISDYNKEYLSESVISGIVEIANIRNIPVFLDTKKILGTWSRNVDYVKINKKEYEENLKHNDPSFYCRNLIVTLGGEGSSWITENVHIPSDKVEVMDVSGAGDTYLAALVVKFLETKSIKQAMEYANKAAAIAVSKHGVVAVNKNELNVR